MTKKNITIKELSNLEYNWCNYIKPRECAKRMKIGKDKVYYYYSRFESNLTVLEIYDNYLNNKSRSGRKKKVISEDKIKYIEEKLILGWSVDEIAGRDKLINASEQHCASTIYRRAEEGLIDIKLLLRKGKKRYRKSNSKREGIVKNIHSIHERNDKYSEEELTTDFGHFEGDTIVGKDHASAVVTIDDRASKYRILLKSDRKSESTCNAIRDWGTFIKELIKSLTLDRGAEFAKWEIIEANGIEVYFGDPGSPCQRGLNEHNNGITRRHLPKGTDLSVYSQEELNVIADKINNKPRKILGYKTAKERLKELTNLDTILV